MKPSPLLALVPALLVSPALGLSDWYVDSGAGGCGSATGTQAAPYCSIAEAVSAALDGDTIFVAAGTYSESVLVNVDVHFVGEDGPAPSIVDASGQSSAPTPRCWAALPSGWESPRPCRPWINAVRSAVLARRKRARSS